MAVLKLTRTQRCNQTKARNQLRREQFASAEYKSGKLTRKQIMHRI